MESKLSNGDKKNGVGEKKLVDAPEPHIWFKHFESVLRHIKLVQEGCMILGKKLIEDGEVELGKILIANSFLHDNSKFYGIEWDHLTRDEEDPSLLKMVVEHHQQTNSHHPEYWGGIKNVPRVYLAECVCDWYARSTEFATDLRSWIKDTAMDRFGFNTSSKVWRDIKYFLELLLDKPFK